MHCPRCGTNAAVDQQFCRSCGLNLEKVAEFLGEELLAPNPETTNNLARLRERQQKLERSGGIVAPATVAMVVMMSSGTRARCVRMTVRIVHRMAVPRQRRAGRLWGPGRVPQLE